MARSKETSIITPIDLKERRTRRGINQVKLADILGVTNIHLSRIERGQANITFNQALDCVDLFGALKVQRGNKVYTVSDGSHDPNQKKKLDFLTAPSADLDLPDEISRLGKEARELLMQAKDIGNFVLAIKCNPKVARPYLLRTAKEAIDLAAWLEEFKESLKAAMPEVYQEAEEIVREEFAAELDMPALEVASA